MTPFSRSFSLKVVFTLTESMMADRRIATQRQTLLQGNAQLVESLLELRVYLTITRRLLRHRVGIVADGLVVDDGTAHAPI